MIEPKAENPKRTVAGKQETQENREGYMENLPDKELTEKIIAAAIQVHRELGPGYLESVYEEALCLELEASGMAFERQKSVEVRYRGQIVGLYRLDLLVESKVVVELKAIKEFEPIHYSVVRSYLKATGLATGLLLNFHSVPLVIKRIGREFKGSES
jgi:GxxExxY protein